MVLIYLTVDVMTFHANFLSFYFRVLVCENYDVNTEPKKKKKKQQPVSHMLVSYCIVTFQLCSSWGN